MSSDLNGDNQSHPKEKSEWTVIMPRNLTRDVEPEHFNHIYLSEQTGLELEGDG